MRTGNIHILRSIYLRGLPLTKSAIGRGGGAGVKIGPNLEELPAAMVMAQVADAFLNENR